MNNEATAKAKSGMVYFLRDCWAPLVAQMVRNLPPVGRPGFNPWAGKIALEEGMATHSSFLAWRIPMDRGAWRTLAHENRRVRHD